MTTALKLKNSSYIQQIPAGSVLDRLLPIDSVLKVVMPVLSSQHPDMEDSTTAFSRWLLVRDCDMSITQAFWLWENYTEQFTRELPTRINQWVAQPTRRESPLVLARQLAKTWVAMKFAKNTMNTSGVNNTTKTSRLKTAVRNIAVFMVCVPVFAAIFTFLGNLRP